MKNPGRVTSVKAIGVALLAMVLIGCSAISSGVITRKGHQDAYWYTTNICAGYNAQGVCTVYVPQTYYVAERWYFDLTNGQQDGWVNVPKSTWEGYEVGDNYTERE